VEVKVDGVACKVLTHALDKITCETGAAAAVSHSGAQPGSHGLRQKVIDPTNKNTSPYLNMRTDGVHPVVETKLLSAWEDAYGNYTKAMTHTNGWFKAPAAGKYRFYLACDDWCRTWLSSTKWDKSKNDAYTMDQINIRSSWTNWRQYNHEIVADNIASNKWISDWITLEANEYYKIEGVHGEHTGSHDHATVSVEYETNDISVTVGDKKSNHHHASKEVQILEVNNKIVYEQFNITVKGSMGGKFQIMFVNPKYDSSNKNSKRTITSREVTDNSNTWGIKYAVQDFYGRGDIWGSAVDVTKLSVNDKFETVEEGAT